MINFLGEDVKQIYIELTNKCRLACPSCARTPLKGKLDNSDIDLEHIKKILAPYNVEERKDFKVILSGVVGDPIYHPDFENIFKYFKEESIAVTVVTNGSAKTEDFWDRISSLTTAKDTWFFSIDGLEDTHVKYRLNGNFNESYKAMVKMAKSDAKVIWKYIVFPHNAHQVNEAQARAEEIKVILELNQTDRTNNPKKYILAGEKWKPERLKTKEANKLILKKIMPKYQGPLSDLMYIEPKCVNGKEPLFVSSKGSIMPCCRPYAEIEADGIDGVPFNLYHQEWNIKNNSLESIINHKFFGELKKTLIHSPEASPYICQKNCGKRTELGEKLLETYRKEKRDV